MATRTGLLRRSERLQKDAVGEIVVKSPTEVQWSVPSFFSLPEDDNFRFRSSSFFFMDGEWCLGCWPNGSWGDTTVWLGLERVHSPSNPTIKYRLGIKAEDGSEVSRIKDHEFEYDGYILPISLLVVMKTAYLKVRLAPRGVVTFFCTFLSSCGECKTYQDRPSKGADKVIETFEELLLSGDHHDIIIKVQDQEIRAHKLIIVARCPVFSSMFRHDTIEKSTGVVTIEDCDPKAFREFLYFLYSGRLKNVSAENVIELYIIADKYQVDEVKSECKEFMMRNMSEEIFCDFISLALRHGEKDLLNSAKNYFVKNVKTIIATVKWQRFHKEYPVESNDLYIKAIDNLIPD